jgi:transposase
LTKFSESKITYVENGMTTDKKTDARQLGHATLEAMRLRAVEAVKAGVKATDLARAYGVHRRIVFRWLTDFYQGGEQGLKAKPIPGRPPKLDAPQMQSLTLSSVSPVKKPLYRCLATRPRAGVEMGNRGVSRHATAWASSRSLLPYLAQLMTRPRHTSRPVLNPG